MVVSGTQRQESRVIRLSDDRQGRSAGLVPAQEIGAIGGRRPGERGALGTAVTSRVATGGQTATNATTGGTEANTTVPWWMQAQAQRPSSQQSVAALE
jgi:hypothetical protein